MKTVVISVCIPIEIKEEIEELDYKVQASVDD